MIKDDMTLGNLWRKLISKEDVNALLTVCLVMAANIWILLGHESFTVAQLCLVIALFVAFAVMFLVTTRDKSFKRDRLTRQYLLAVQYAIVLALFAASPLGFNAILLVVWSAQLPYFLPLRWTLLSSPLWSALPWFLYALVWQTNGQWVSGLLFWTFNLFALLMMENRRKAEMQQQRAEQATRELQALQNLMQQASRKDERTRIARDIHDVVGHHLTALSLHLQVASHTVDAAHKPAIEQCLSIARLLLADVREAVSDIRELGELDLCQAIETLIEPLRHRVEFTLRCGDTSALSLSQAQTVLRCVQESVTNSLRHGHATRIEIAITHEAGQYVAEVSDNGKASSGFVAGNGLTGIQERMAMLNGEATFNASSSGFATRLVFPEAL
ncbi:sensor histidine kinase [Alteromonas sp. AMM-1]|uniref:sensor histidine kinase n=1 Tax=Alteromonas sp. AMM-1 TaxID=3394233 RepID=UPI0039A679A0